MLLILLDSYLHTLYRHMLTMYYQSPESNGQTEENAMRSMPWPGLMALFKKACKIEDLTNTAAYTNAASALPTPPRVFHSPSMDNRNSRNPQDVASAPFTVSQLNRKGYLSPQEDM